MDQLLTFVEDIEKFSLKEQSLVSSSTSSFKNVSLMNSFSLLDILNFVLSSNILVIFELRFKLPRLVKGDSELRSINGDFFSNNGVFFNLSIVGESFGLNNGELVISPKTLRFDGVAIGEFSGDCLLKSKECGIILIL